MGHLDNYCQHFASLQTIPWICKEYKHLLLDFQSRVSKLCTQTPVEECWIQIWKSYLKLFTSMSNFKMSWLELANLMSWYRVVLTTGSPDMDLLRLGVSRLAGTSLVPPGLIFWILTGNKTSILSLKTWKELLTIIKGLLMLKNNEELLKKSFLLQCQAHGRNLIGLLINET